MSFESISSRICRWCSHSALEASGLHCEVVHRIVGRYATCDEWERMVGGIA
jgi:hypothetical protein